MYAFVDRPVGQLPAGSALLLAAMRRWNAAHASGDCPTTALVDGFVELGAEDALPSFNMAMMLISHEARLPMALLGEDDRMIGADEAVLLTVWDDLARSRDLPARQTLSLFIEPAMADATARALDDAVSAFTLAGIDLAAPEFREETRR